ncbi:hypothetical protein CTV96_09500 [Bacillus altitudinis]|uniref:hypothetical protein n=1 Tax=Bacillus altitudinis TaxID=293387 RepID=UPI000C2432C9|nr:hypothetical protein [Bacillus altitudinis]PJI12373.1 hypothetical protein CTV96_09500 [Bacillus altitudinis]PKQ85613.1 hypothetical protein CTV98_007595 [Bacillus altitudinis]
MKPSEITITHHAKQRLKTRFGIDNQHVACNWIAQKMEHAKYLGITVDESGKEARMYASKGVVIHFAVDTNVVITVYKEKDNAGSIAKRLLIDAYNIVQQNATETISQYESFSAELDEELRWLDEELKRTRSKAKRIALQARINAVQMRIDELPTESLEIKRKVTRYARGVAAYV